jgi:predicted acetyltransferase
MTLFEYGIISEPEDAKRLGTILQQCFNSTPETNETYFQRIGLENFRVIRRGGKIVGGLAILEMGQWFGCECVPMAGIAAVGIAPEERGSGAALELMQQTVKEIYAKGLTISTLYPATQRLYRKVGYEQGGSLCGWEMPTSSIHLKERSLPMQPVIPLQHEVFRELYQQQAKVTNGYLGRNQAIWEEVVEKSAYAYLIGKETQPEGYIIFSQQQVDNSSLIDIRDCALLTTAAVRRFWTFIADHRSQIEKVRWRHSAVESLTLQLSEQTAEIYRSLRWMLRVVDVGTLEKRGYPQEMEAELHLEVQDDLLAQNNGKFVLNVSHGRGEVTKGGKGELQLEVNGLAPLYTGLFTPYQLQLTGQLQATQTALAVATQMFAGSSPWMPDFF